MAGGHFRSACETTFMRATQCMSKGRKRKRATEKETPLSGALAAAWYMVRPHCLRISITPWTNRRKSAVLDTQTAHTHRMVISLYIQSALLAALEIFVEGYVLLRDMSAVMFEILFPRCPGVCYFLRPVISLCEHKSI